MNIGVDFARLQATADHVDQTTVRINAQLDELRSKLNPMIAEWDGQAREEYSLAQKQWDDAIAHLNTTLAQIGRALHSANEGYQMTEKSNAGRFGG